MFLNFINLYTKTFFIKNNNNLKIKLYSKYQNIFFFMLIQELYLNIL